MPRDPAPDRRVKRLARTLLIREGEGGTVLYLAGFLLLLGAGLAIGRASADALFLKRYGIEALPLTYVVLSLCMAVTFMLYMAVVDHLPAERFFKRLLVTLALLLTGTWLGMRFAPASTLYPFYYLLFKVADELLLVHAALYASQNLNTLQLKRLAPLTLAGAQCGALFGALFASCAASRLGIQNLLLVWLLLVLCAILLLSAWHVRHGASPFYRAQRKTVRGLDSALRHVYKGMVFTRRSPLLRSAALALLCLVFAFYTLAYSVNRVYTQTFASEAALAGFLAILIAVNSALTLLIQLFVTNRVLQRFGVPRINLVFPVTLIAAFLGLMGQFALPAALFGSFNRDALLEAVHNPVRSLFFNAVPAYMQGRTRAAAVAVVMPVGLVVCGLLLWLMQRLANPIWFLLPGLLASLGFLYFNRRMNAAYGTELVNSLRARVFVPALDRPDDLRAGGDAVVSELADGLRRHDVLFLSLTRRLCNAFPEQAPGILLPELGRAAAPHADVLIRLLQTLRPEGLAEALQPLLDHPDLHLRATALSCLVGLRRMGLEPALTQALDSDSPRLRAAAVAGILALPCPTLRRQALDCARQLLEDDSPERQLAALTLQPTLQAAQSQETTGMALRLPGILQQLLTHSPDRAKRALLSTHDWSEITDPALATTLLLLLRDTDPALRTLAAQRIGMLSPSAQLPLLETALGDGHAAVRTAALAILATQTDRQVPVGHWLDHDSRLSPRAQRTLIESELATELSPARLQQIAADRIEQAGTLLDAWRRISADAVSGDNQLSLLRHRLQERAHDLIDLSLLALAPLHEAGQISVIRAGIRSGDQRHIAAASEALGTLQVHPGTRALAELLESSSATSLRHPAFDNLNAALAWAGNQVDDHTILTATSPEGHDTMETERTLTDLHDRVLLLKNTDLFREVAIDDLHQVAMVLEDIEYFPGERVFDIGEQGDHLYLIASGRIGLSLDSDPESRNFIATPGAGDYFGEMNLLDDLPRSATAHVLEPTRMLSLEKARLRGLLLSYPEIGLGIMRGLCARLRNSHQ